MTFALLAVAANLVAYLIHVGADALVLTQAQVLEAIEAKRTYSAINYYQQANFPSLAGVRIFANIDEARAAFPSRQFRCPACNGLSTDPYACNVGGECDWKSYGLFGTMGKGFRFTVRDTFLDAPHVAEIFMPLEIERQQAGGP